MGHEMITQHLHRDVV